MHWFTYFLECYFHMGADKEELPVIIDAFKKQEKPTTVQKFIEELRQNIAAQKWELFQHKIKSAGNRIYSIEQTKQLVHFIVEHLTHA